MKRLLFAAAVYVVMAAMVALVGGPALATQGTGVNPGFAWSTPIANYIEAGYENFTYANQNLALVAGWPGTSTGNMGVSSNGLVTKPQAVGAPSYCTWTLGSAYAPASGKIIVGIRTGGSGGNQPAVLRGYYGIEALDASGNVMGAIEGYGGSGHDKAWGRVGANGTTGSVPGTAGVTTGQIPGSGVYLTSLTPMWMVINTSTQSVEFFYNPGTATSLGALSYSGGGTSLAKVRIAVYGNTWTTKPFSYQDDLTYGTNVTVPEPSSLLAFSVFGVGMLGLIRRRRA